MQTVIHFDTRWFGEHGIGRFAQELFDRLPGTAPLHVPARELSLLDPLACSLAASRLRTGLYFSPGFNPPLYSAVPVVFCIHDLIHLKVPGESSPVRRLYYRTVVRPAARRAWRILTVSEHSRQDILEWAGVAPDCVHVVGNGVSAAFGPQGPAHAPGYPYLLHVGRRASHKNVDRMLAAFAESRARVNHKLVFTGEPDPATLRSARAHGVDAHIEFAGTADDARLASFYRGAKALVYPSLYEGFGLPVIEAMACGAPVITANATSTAEIGSEGAALLVDPLNRSALANAMDRVVADGPLRNELRSRGLERSTSYTWERVVERVQRALDAGTRDTISPFVPEQHSRE